MAKDLGADVALIVTPYYNKPTQEGIYRHFEAIATRVAMPIVVYNIPGRCGTNIETATLMRIAQLPHIVGVKEASGNINQVGDILHTIVKKYPHFSLFSGDDILTLPMMALGASGVISVVSNLVPDLVIALTSAAMQGQFDRAQEMHYHLLPLYKAAFIETNPVPIKAAMNLCGMPAGNCRLPLWQMAPENLTILHQLLMHMQLVKKGKE
jgi:4-hydroxy-tetrahydrodipicolinate synthase